ncbi:peptidase U32 family protein [Thermohalobacter berrensis]|uniref:Peptidase U32 n=1 Tax=Thermohalobacter berrensis TaxID=99594 RepID=A0A419TAW3_9FIRM|nr:U32 family peptidase [Thermohalobacter berrensis]RKD34603.1 peptidase U32 [Thermohalobacter berrensis]
MKKPELLAPAGNLEKLKMAIIYGADAVYIGGKKFGLRASAKNFTIDQMKEGLKFAHERGKKVYVTLNIIPHNEDLNDLPEYVKELDELGVDAVIISDPGVLSIVKENAPNLEIHLSTQANTTNYKSAKFWYNQGIKRIITARELSLNEIKEIIAKTPEDLEVEAFVHGAMCISYSGRCLLSNYMAHRDANRGECAHPCRWKYFLMEEKRPGEYFPVVEDERGTYIFNSKDLCMLKHIPQLIEAGISSFKIEGRMKSAYYVATVVRAYRMVIDEYLDNSNNYVYNDIWLEEIKKASHRDFTTGFYFGKPKETEQVYTSSSYIRTYDFTGLILDYNNETSIATVEQRNRMFVGDDIEIFGPNREHFSQKIEQMWDEKGNEIDVAPHPQQIIKIKTVKPVRPWDIIRKPRKE